MKPKYLHHDVVPLIQDKHPGKQIAFSTVRDATDLFSILTVVCKDEPGHSPLPHQLAYGTETEMADHAAELNDKVLGLTKEMAFGYVASSMRGRQALRR